MGPPYWSLDGTVKWPGGNMALPLPKFILWMNSSHNERQGSGFVHPLCSHTELSSRLPGLPPAFLSLDLRVLQLVTLSESYVPSGKSLATKQAKICCAHRALTPSWETRLRPGIAFQSQQVQHPTFPATSWSILTIKKDLHANFTICLLVLFAKSFSTVAGEEIQRDKVMGVDDC